MVAKILGFDGSGRVGSMNRKLLEVVAAEATKAGAEVKLINLYDYDIPLYNGDLEAEHGLPEFVIELKKLFDQYDGFLIATPEYNGGYSPLLKNTIDWVTRPAGDGIPKQPLKGKIAGLMAASPGPLSGLRGIHQLNTMLFGINMTILGEIVAVGSYATMFDADGNLTDDRKKAAAQHQAQRLVKLLS